MACKYNLGDKNEEREKEMKQEYSQTCDWIKKRLGERVARVDVSNRLSSSPCVLVAAKFGWSANMERLDSTSLISSVVNSLYKVVINILILFLRLMRAQSIGDTSSLDFMRSRKVFEINPEHEIIKRLNVSVHFFMISFHIVSVDIEAYTTLVLCYELNMLDAGS